MTDVIDLIEADHRDIEDLFTKFASTDEPSIALEICDRLDRHTAAEARTLSPVIAAEVPNGKQMAGEGEDEHTEARQLIGLVRESSGADDLNELMRALEEAVAQHVDSEETEVLPQARAVLEPEHLEALGRDFETAKER